MKTTGIIYPSLKLSLLKKETPMNYQKQFAGDSLIF